MRASGTAALAFALANLSVALLTAVRAMTSLTSADAARLEIALIAANGPEARLNAAKAAFSFDFALSSESWALTNAAWFRALRISNAFGSL